jgi:hypothetical protein
LLDKLPFCESNLRGIDVLLRLDFSTGRVFSVKRIHKRLAIAMAVAAGLVVSALPAHATALAPGTSVAPGALGSAPSSAFLVASTGAVPFGNLTTGGMVLENVYANPGNSIAAGDLTFTYQFAVSNGDIGRLTASNFAGFQTNVFTVSALGQIAAITADRGNSGDPVGFNFTNPPGVLPGQTSVIMVIDTNATQFKPGNIGVIDAVTSNIPGFAPSGQVPEPASVVMFGLGFAGFCGYSWKRRKSAS